MSDNYETSIPIYFNKNNDFIKNLIKEDSIKNNIIEEYILYHLSLFTDGFIILENQQKIGRPRKIKSYSIKGYILFVHDKYISQIQGKIIYTDKSMKGIITILLDNVKKFALNVKATYWIFNILPYKNLISLYEKYGFIKRNKIFNTDNIFTSQIMDMKIDNFDPDDLSNEEYDNRIDFIESNNNL